MQLASQPGIMEKEIWNTATLRAMSQVPRKSITLCQKLVLTESDA